MTSLHYSVKLFNKLNIYKIPYLFNFSVPNHLSRFLSHIQKQPKKNIINYQNGSFII